MGVKDLFKSKTDEKPEGYDRKLPQDTILNAVDSFTDATTASHAKVLAAIELVIDTLNAQNGITAAHTGTIRFDYGGKKHDVATTYINLSCQGVAKPIENFGMKIWAGRENDDIIVAHDFSYEYSIHESGRINGFDFHDANAREDFLTCIGRTFGRMRAQQLPSYNEKHPLFEEVEGVPKLKVLDRNI